jgi:hypothetical protein
MYLTCQTDYAGDWRGREESKVSFGLRFQAICGFIDERIIIVWQLE